MPSKSTVPVTIRLPVEVLAKIQSNRKGVTVSAYIAKLVTLQVTRKR